LTAKAVATFVPNPDTPVEIGSPVALVSVADDGVPSAGVTSVGDVANTSAPEPVSSVTAAARFAEEGVARKVATPVPRPEIPVATGSPVALVSVADDGVPSAGVTSVGDVANTSAPEPVSSVTAAARLEDEGVPKNVATPVPSEVIPVPPFATGNVPFTPVVNGKPVQFVKVPPVGIPMSGVIKVGEEANTNEPEPVSSETADANTEDVNVPKLVMVPEAKVIVPDAVKLVSVAEAA
jgi:hypothetical protein